MSLRRFIALWTHPDDAPDLVLGNDLENAERRLQTRRQPTIATLFFNSVCPVRPSNYLTLSLIENSTCVT